MECDNIAMVTTVRALLNDNKREGGVILSSQLLSRPYRVCYDRVPPSFVISPTMTVWLVSAMWHGFYPSYYLTFVCCGFITEAARKVNWLLTCSVLWCLFQSILTPSSFSLPPPHDML